MPHFTGIANSIGTAETYGLTYTASSLGPPFGTDPTYSGLTTTLLKGMTVPTANAWQFGYDSAGAGELLSAISPLWGRAQLDLFELCLHREPEPAGGERPLPGGGFRSRHAVDLRHLPARRS